MNPQLRFMLVLACFAFSGFAALLYETVWTREFSFVFGTSGLAVSTVLAAYMGGLALGAALAGRFVDRVARPVLVYGLLELGIAAAALAVPWAIEASRTLHVALLRGVTDPGSPLALALYLATSFVILAVPTTFMGATLPLLARHAIHADEEIGPRVGALYAINTFGAIAGTLATAFFLMPEYGLRTTVYVGAAVNGLVFLGAAWLARAGTSAVSPDAVADRAPSIPASDVARGDPADGPSGLARAVLGIAFCAGVASFTYEVLWVRLLEHVLGGSVYAFAAMLASFLIGIALGGACASRFAVQRSSALRGMAITQAGVALASMLAYRGVARLPGWIDQETFLGGMDATLRLAGLAALLLLPATLCIGAMFPFAVRALADDAAEAAHSTARAYSANTLGAILGSIAAGFWLLPALGFAGTLILAASINVALALVAWWGSRPRSRLVLGLIGAVVLAGVASPPATPWLLLRASPIPSSIAPRDDDQNVLFHAVGRSASVIAIETDEGIRIRSNGIPESLVTRPGARSGLVPAAHWMGALPALSPQGARRMLMIGLGGGVALEMVPPDIEEIDVVELEPQVVEANRTVAPLRQFDPARDARIRIRLGDARSILELEREPYDAIVSQPSHPWTAGSSHLYTRDFFERVKTRLAPGGIFVQWLGLSYVDEALLRSFVATLCDAFPNVRLYRPADSSVLFLASEGSLDLESQVEALMASSPELMIRIGMRTPSELAAAMALDEKSAREFSEGAPLITDDRNTMATRAPRVFRSLLGEIDAVLAPYDPLLRDRPGITRWDLIRPLLALGRVDQAMRVARSFSRPQDRQIAQALVIAQVRPNQQVIQRLAGVPPTSPAHAQASWLLSETLKRDILAQTETGRRLEARHQGEASSVIEGWRLASQERWSELEGLDRTYAEIPVGALWWQSALSLRVAWRIESGDSNRLGEALVLLDRDPRWSPARLAVRAWVAAKAGDLAAARSSLFEIAGLPEEAWSPAVQSQAIQALDLFAHGGGSEADVGRLRSLFERRARGA